MFPKRKICRDRKRLEMSLHLSCQDGDPDIEYVLFCLSVLVILELKLKNSDIQIKNIGRRCKVNNYGVRTNES